MQASGRYSQCARRAMMQARAVAKDQHHASVDTSHLLAGIMRAEGCIGLRVLERLGLSQETVEHAVALLHLHRYKEELHVIPMSSALRAALTFAVEEANALDHHYVGTEHLLLGMARCASGAAKDILQASEITFDQLRRQVQLEVEAGESEIGLERALRVVRLSELSRRVISRAHLLAEDMHQEQTTLLHLMMALAQEKRSPAGRLLRECGLDEDQLAWDTATSAVPSSADDMEELLDDAVFAAERLGSHYTGTDHLVLVLCQNRHGKRALARYGVNANTLQTCIKALFQDQH